MSEMVSKATDCHAYGTMAVMLNVRERGNRREVGIEVGVKEEAQGMKGLRYVDKGSDINIERTVAESRYSSSQTRAEYSLMTAQTRRANRGG
jgi:hypothetical protein